MEAKMKKLALFLLAAVSLLDSGSIATAQYYYGGGYYGGPDPYYRYRDGGYGGGYGYGSGGAIIGYNNFGQQEVWYPIGPHGRCPRGFTVQGGFCKQYRGY
jgi:asparagine N-glycosylation enzyme membrane subunit Stt3